MVILQSCLSSGGPAHEYIITVNFKLTVITRLSIITTEADVYYTERKPKNKKRGRPGNEAKRVL